MHKADILCNITKILPFYLDNLCKQRITYNLVTIENKNNGCDEIHVVQFQINSEKNNDQKFCYHCFFRNLEEPGTTSCGTSRNPAPPLAEPWVQGTQFEKHCCHRLSNNLNEWVLVFSMVTSKSMADTRYKT